MGDQFSIDLPPRFQFTETDPDKKDREVEEYLRKLSNSVEEMLKRMWTRIMNKIEGL